MIIRRELPADTGTLRALFTTVYLGGFFDRVETDDARIPGMSFVSLGEGQEVIGHVGASRGMLGEVPVLALVPPFGGSRSTRARRKPGSVTETFVFSDAFGDCRSRPGASRF